MTLELGSVITPPPHTPSHFCFSPHTDGVGLRSIGCYVWSKKDFEWSSANADHYCPLTWHIMCWETCAGFKAWKETLYEWIIFFSGLIIWSLYIWAATCPSSKKTTTNIQRAQTSVREAMFPHNPYNSVGKGRAHHNSVWKMPDDWWAPNVMVPFLAHVSYLHWDERRKTSSLKKKRKSAEIQQHLCSY